MQIKRTTIPYVGRDRYPSTEASAKKIRRITSTSSSSWSGGGGGGWNPGGGGILVNPGNAEIQRPFNNLVAEVSPSTPTININTDSLPAIYDVSIGALVANENAVTFVGNPNVVTEDNLGITGLPNGVTATAVNNGTYSTVVRFSFSSGFSAPTSEIVIPVYASIAPWQELFEATKTEWAARPKTTQRSEVKMLINAVHTASIEGHSILVRGPIFWRPSLDYTFYSGNGEDGFLDLIRYGKSTYKCTTSYTQVPGSSWSSVSGKWTADNRFDVIASNIDLAANENIELMQTNRITFSDGTGITTQISYDDVETLTVTAHGEISSETGMFCDGYVTALGDIESATQIAVKDNSHNIVAKMDTGGIEAVEIYSSGDITAGNSISATADILASGNVEANAVNAATNVNARNVNVKDASGNIVTQMTASGVSTRGFVGCGSLTSSNQASAKTFEAKDASGNTTVTISGLNKSVIAKNGLIQVTDSNNAMKCQLSTSGISTPGTASIGGTIFGGDVYSYNSVSCKRLDAYNNNGVPITTIQNGNISTQGSFTSQSVETNSYTLVRNVPGQDEPKRMTMPKVDFDFDIALVTDNREHFDIRSGYWHFNGISMGVIAEDYPYLIVCDNMAIQQASGADMGEWLFSETEDGLEICERSGIYTHLHVEKDNTVFIVVDDGAGYKPR